MTQAEALDILKLGHNVFITGAAGSGKTYLLNEYINYLKKYNVDVAITASTGIAATHMGGMTIHSWSGLGIRNNITERDLEELSERKYIWDRFAKVKVLIIDEVSMLHHFRLDLVDQVVRHFKKSDLPFGGIQVILCGDFFQLPPINRMGEKEGKFSYHSETWKGMELKVCYLEEQHRQKDNIFLRILNDIRANDVSEQSIEHLEARMEKDITHSVPPTKLYTHNVDVDTLNHTELDKIDQRLYGYDMTSKGNKTLVEILKKSCLAPESLRLKVGAKVLFVKNNFEQGYANGTLGEIIDCDLRGPTVRTVSGQVIRPEPATWSVEEDGKVKAEIKQFPLRLAWAITVHKSQGMSLDAVEVDLSKSFERGMGYVALSRVRSLEGLKLIGINQIALQVHEEVLEVDKEFQAASARIAEALHKLPQTELKERQAIYMNSIKPGTKEKSKKETTLEKTTKLLYEGRNIEQIARLREMSIKTVFDHLEELKEKGDHLAYEHLRKDISVAKFKTIWQAFKTMYVDNPTYKLTPIKEKLGGDKYSFEDIRLVRLFMR